MWLTLLRNDARLFVAEQRRYALESTVSTLVFVAMFTGVFYGSTRLLPGGDVRSMYTGFLLWLVASSVVGGITKAVSEDISNGTLEVMNTFATPYRTLLMSRTVVRLMYDLVVLFACVGAMAMAVDVEAFPPGSLLTVAFFVVSTVVPAAGVGLLLAGLQIYAKRAQVIVLLGMVLFVVSVYWAPTVPSAVSLLPGALHAGFAKAASAGQAPGILGVGATMSVSAGYWALGVYSFQWLLARAKREGTLGQL